MTPIFRAGLAVALVLGSATAVSAKSDPMVGGAAMYPTKTIVENAVNSRITPRSSPPSRPLAWSKR